MDIEIDLLCINSSGALYEVTIEGSLSRAQFTIKADMMEEDIFENDHFKQCVHNAVRRLKTLSPDFHQDKIIKLFSDIEETEKSENE